MLPDHLLLVMCPHCNAPLWINDQEKVGEIDRAAARCNEYIDAVEYRAPSLDDYFTLLSKGVATYEREHYIRLRAWWAGNDARRNSAAEIPLSPREADNLNLLAEMLDVSDTRDLVMKAEAMRELGRFDDASALLANAGSTQVSEAVAIIRSLVDKRDRYVRRMHFD